MAENRVGDWEDLQGRESWDSLMRGILLTKWIREQLGCRYCVGECLVILFCEQSSQSAATKRSSHHFATVLGGENGHA